VTKPEHISDAVAALDIALDADEVAQVEKPYAPHQIAGFA
jgi:1-deoxyxylulose-5-phosphate synthase